MFKIQGGGDIDLKTAEATLQMLQVEQKPKKKKKKKKEKLPAPFSAEAATLGDENLDDLDNLDDLPPELLAELANYEPTEEEIAAEFEVLKQQEEEKRMKKVIKIHYLSNSNLLFELHFESVKYFRNFC